LPGVEAVAIGNSTFDSNTGTYIFIGVNAGNFKLYSVNASTGNIINSPTIWQNNNKFSALEFNNRGGGQLYALYQDVDSNNYSVNFQSYYTDLRLVEIDLVTGISTLVDPQSTVIGGYLPGYAVGGLCFDQQSQTYIVRVQNELSTYLKLVDVSTANIVASTAINSNDYFYELQVDNSIFANSFYDLNVSVENIEPGINDLNSSKQLINIVDVLGRETPFKPNTPLLYIYDDGTVERKMTIKP
jgi:hypothetical protein